MAKKGTGLRAIIKVAKAIDKAGKQPAGDAERRMKAMVSLILKPHFCLFFALEVLMAPSTLIMQHDPKCFKFHSGYP